MTIALTEGFFESARDCTAEASKCPTLQFYDNAHEVKGKSTMMR